MNLLIETLKWDIKLIVKYGIVPVALGITAMYCIGFLLTDTSGKENAIAALVFSDPAMYGFLFTSIMVLFEKDANTHQVLAVTPLPTSYYIISKAIAFTLLALLCGLAMIISAQPAVFQPFLFVLAVVLTSSLFVFIGVIGVSYVHSFNQFIMTIPIVLAPVCLPFLDYFNLFNSPLFYLIPTQACLLLFKGSMQQIHMWQIIYALVYLFAWNMLSYKWALKNFKQRILKTH